jgi:hypothetical protein
MKTNFNAEYGNKSQAGHSASGCKPGFSILVSVDVWIDNILYAGVGTKINICMLGYTGTGTLVFMGTGTERT